MVQNENTSKRARTRSALILAAIEVVGEAGFSAASLDEIARRAGMTKGAIYSNFGSKADLMLAVARSHAPAFAPAYVPGAPLAIQLRAVARSIAAMLPQLQKTARLQAQFQSFLQGEPELRKRIAGELTAQIKPLVRLVAKHHAVELAVPANILVMTLQALSLGFAHQSMATPALVTPAVILKAFEMVGRGAAKPSSTEAVAKR